MRIFRDAILKTTICHLERLMACDCSGLFVCYGRADSKGESRLFNGNRIRDAGIVVRSCLEHEYLFFAKKVQALVQSFAIMSFAIKFRTRRPTYYCKKTTRSIVQSTKVLAYKNSGKSKFIFCLRDQPSMACAWSFIYQGAKMFLSPGKRQVANTSLCIDFEPWLAERNVTFPESECLILRRI